MNVFLNCKQSRVSHVLQNPVAADETELSISQNGLEFLFPYDFRFDVNDFITEVA